MRAFKQLIRQEGGPRALVVQNLWFRYIRMFNHATYAHESELFDGTLDLDSGEQFRQKLIDAESWLDEEASKLLRE